jgi:hypothetical protein
MGKRRVGAVKIRSDRTCDERAGPLEVALHHARDLLDRIRGGLPAQPPFIPRLVLNGNSRHGAPREGTHPCEAVERVDLQDLDDTLGLSFEQRACC